MKQHVAYLMLLLLVATLWSDSSEAHKQSDSYLSIQPAAVNNALDIQWDIALRDLEHAIGVDGNGDGQITWGELRARQDAIAGLAIAHLQIAAAEEVCPLRFARLLVDDHVDGKYAVLHFNAACRGPPDKLRV